MSNANKFVTSFMNNLAGKNLAGEQVKLTEALQTVFAKILAAQVTVDDDADVVNFKPAFKTLLEVLTFIATPKDDRPDAISGYTQDVFDTAADSTATETGLTLGEEIPSEEPTEAPSEEPTEAPSEEPTEAPSEEPTEAPSEEPTDPSVPGESFRLTESTVAVAEADAQATVYEVTGTAAQYANAKTFTVTIPAADEDSEATKIDFDVAEATGVASLRGILNKNTDFKGAGLVATSDAVTGKLVITDAQGRALEDVSLIGQSTPSSATVELLQSRLVNTEVVHLTIDGQQVELRGVSGETGADVATSIEGKLNAIKDADGQKPYDKIKVKFDSATSKLTISDEDRREISDVSLQRTSDSKVVLTVDSAADVNKIQTLSITIDGVTKDVDVSENDLKAAQNNADNNAIADAIKEAFGGEGFVGLTSTVVDATESAPATITITDTLGREFGATQLLGKGDGAVASETVVGPLSAEEIGQFSVTIGSGTDAVTIEKASVGAANQTALVARINKLLKDADLKGADVNGGAYAIAEGTDSIKIVNKAGTGISNIYVGTALDEKDASSVEISGLTDVLAKKVAAFEVKIGGQTFEIDAVTKVAASLVLSTNTKSDATLADVATIEDLALFVKAALQAQETVTDRTDITVTVEGQTLVITDAAGRAISDVVVKGVAGSALPTYATVSGIDDNAVNLDLGHIEIKYNDKDGKAHNEKLSINGQLDLVDKSSFLDLSYLSSEAIQTIKLAEFNATANNKGDLPDSETGGPKSNQLVKLPDLETFVGKLVIENMTLADDNHPDTLNDLLDLSATTDGWKSAVKSIQLDEVKPGTATDAGAYLTATITLNLGGTIVLTNVIKAATAYAKLEEETNGTVNLASLNALGVAGVEGLISESFSDDKVELDEDRDDQGVVVDTLAGLEAYLSDKLGDEFTVQAFGEDETLVITDTAGNELTSVEFKTAANGVSVVDGVAITAAVAATTNQTLAIGEVGAADNATSGAPVFGVAVTVEEAGAPSGLNAPQIGNNGVVTDSELTPVTIIGTEYDAGAEGAPVGSGIELTQAGAAAVEASAWTATFEVDFEGELEEAYTFTLSLTEVLGEEAAEGTEAAVFNFTVDAVAGETSADLLVNMAAKVDAHEAFAAVVSEEGQLVVTAEAEATNYTAETGVELVAVVEPQIVEVA